VDTAQLELEFARKLAELDKLAGTPLPPPPPPGQPRRRPAPTGRRDLSTLDLAEERIELVDPLLDGLVKRMGFEESSRICYRRGGFVRTVVARIKYLGDTPSPTNCLSLESPVPPKIVTAPMPPQILPRSIATASLVAHIASEKFCQGMPLFRQEELYSRMGVPLDRGMMSRWLEDVGMTVGATVLKAARDEAMRTAFCLSTDATGIAIQPDRNPAGPKSRQPCRKGHFFVQIADRDHVFFEYVPRETSAAVAELFRGFSGYVQADAKSVYDILFRDPSERPPMADGETDTGERQEVACWSHARRGLWEAAISKDPIAREGLLRIARLFDNERAWKGKPSNEIKDLRAAHSRPHVDAIFQWARIELEKVKDQRGILRSAIGYLIRQQTALSRFLDDGRLLLDNNASERELRRIAIGRKAWLFAGSDDHAQAAGNLLSLIASARLHGLDPETYLRDLFCVLPQWPRDRYLELAPRYWAATAARLIPAELEAEIGWITVPPPPEKPAPR